MLDDIVSGNGNFKEVSGYTFKDLAPSITCVDGTTLSVQASHSHYCTPRNNHGPYTEVEVGFPSVRPPDSWREYFDGEWQKPGVLGSLARMWKERRSIWYALEQGLTEKRWWYFKRLVTFKDNTTDSVYGYVPVEMVREFIESHGGEVEQHNTDELEQFWSDFVKDNVLTN